MDFLAGLVWLERKHELNVRAWALHLFWSAISISLIVNNRFGSNLGVDVRILMLSGGFNLGYWHIFGGPNVPS